MYRYGLEVGQAETFNTYVHDCGLFVSGLVVDKTPIEHKECTGIVWRLVKLKLLTHMCMIVVCL